MTFDPSSLCGWVDHPDRHAVAATFPGFAQATVQLMQVGAPETDTLLYRAFKDTLGGYVPYPRQEIGDCVSFGHAHGNDLLLCVEAALQGSNSLANRSRPTPRPCTAPAREAGNMLGWQDGCYGSAAVKAMTTMGSPCPVRSSAYSGKRAKDWGYHGAPTEIK